MDLVKDQVTARTLYALLANSPSVKNAHLTRLSIHAADSEHLRTFANFANLAGAAPCDVELRVQPDVPLDRKPRALLDFRSANRLDTHLTRIFHRTA